MMVAVLGHNFALIRLYWAWNFVMKHPNRSLDLEVWSPARYQLSYVCSHVLVEVGGLTTTKGSRALPGNDDTCVSRRVFYMQRTVNTTSCSHRVRLSAWFGHHRMTFSRHHTGLRCWSTIDLVSGPPSGEIHANLKIPYSCCHLPSKSGQCDAAI
jgi:hypothetical protein